ncbi:MAG: hypothetical protein U0165_02560 [Polyangiaceae bacterium]
MTKVEIVGDKLVLTVNGIDVVLAFKKHLEVPFSSITGVELGIAAEAQSKLDDSIRLPGAYMPGIAIAGSYLEHGKWMFWNIHKGANAVSIKLNHEKYEYLVVEVEDPKATVALISSKLSNR